MWLNQNKGSNFYSKKLQNMTCSLDKLDIPVARKHLFIWLAGFSPFWKTQNVLHLVFRNYTHLPQNLATKSTYDDFE